MGYAHGYGYGHTYKTEKRAGASGGGGALLIGETDGFATDFTYSNNAQRVAIKAANSVTYLGLESVYTNAGTSPKMVYDINGTLVWVPHNFVVQSNDMSTWTATNTTRDINTITAVASTAIHAVQKNLTVTIAGAPYTISVTLQAGTWRYAYVTSYRASNFTVSCVVDMVAGTITQTANGASGVASNYGIVSEGGGKFRVTFTDSSASAGVHIIVIGFANAATGNTFDATGHLISTTAATDSFGIERVQINRGTAPTAYVPTMTVARMGLALDYDPVTHALKGLLCEGNGTNLLLQSSQFDNASWSKSAVTVTANTTTAPDGTVTADSLIPTAGTGIHTIWGSGTVVSGTNYTFSVYVKPINAQRYVELIYGGATGFKWVSVTFDMQTSTVTQQVNGSDGGNVYTGSSITSVGNGWFRVTLSSAIADTTGSGSIEAVTTGTPTHGTFGNVSWTANGTDGIAAWGAQLEVFTATSPIPTYTTTVTRTADACNFASATISPSVTAGSWWIDVNGFIVANGQMLVKYASTGIPMGMPSGGSISITDGTSISKLWTSTGVHKVASAFQVGDRAITFDGVSVSTDTGQTSGLLAPGATISLGVTYWGYIRKVRYVPRRKTNAELALETSPVGGTLLLAGEQDGFATDFTWATDTERVAVRASNVTTPQGLDTFFANAGTSPKRVYDATGTLVWSPHNQFLRSEDFTNASWVKTGTPIVTAHTIEDDDAASQEFINQSISNAVVGQRYTISIWLLKDAVTTRFPVFHVVGTGAYMLSINTSTGATAVPSNSYASASHLVEDLGTYWKLKITFVAENTTTALRVYPAFSTTLGGSHIAAVGVITIDRVQWNRGSVPTAYLPTTSAARNGLAVDYDPATLTSRGLLCEPAATNSIVQSTNFANAAWAIVSGVGDGMGLTVNAAIAPNGFNEAVKITEITGEFWGNNEHTWGQNTTGTVTGTMSIYAKASGSRSQFVIVDDNNGLSFGFADGFDLATGTIFHPLDPSWAITPSTGGARMVPVGNGWYRCSIPTTLSSSVNIYHAKDQFMGYDAVTGEGLYFWGPQLEATNTVATSYIPTYAASATRTLDLVTTPTSAFSWNAAGPNSIVVAATPLIASPGYYFTFHDGTDNERIMVDTGAGTKKGRFLVIDNNVIQADLGVVSAPTIGTTYKVGGAAATNDIATCVDGGTVQTDAIATLPTVTTLTVGGARATTGAVYVKNIMSVPRRMTNAELQGKTT